MSIIERLLKELEQEALTTRKMLERVPDDKFDYKPHEKSMEMLSLAIHIAELPSWVTMAITTSELDFASFPYTKPDIQQNADLLNVLEQSLESARKSLGIVSEEQLEEMWTLRNAEQIYSTSSKYEVIRMAYSQIIHHRAQLGVYLRLLNIPIPGSYGPSADEQSF